MLLLVLFAFLAGIITVLSPCILPLLPIILSSTDGTGKQKPIGVVAGFVASFTFFTLFLSTLVRWSGIPAESLRFVSVGVLVIFGLSLIIPSIQAWLERIFSQLAGLMPQAQNQRGFWGGMLLGMSLGLLWTPCVGPILAAVISLAITGTVTFEATLITLAYALGTALPMLAIMLAGSAALQQVPWLVKNTANIQRAFGVIMMLTALAIAGQLDRQFQTWVLSTFPQYGTGLTKFEDIPLIQNQLTQLGTPAQLPNNPRSKSMLAPELEVGGEWLNTQPLKLADLKGKVVLLDFWTYSCINCQRTLPYLKDWWTKYQDQGLVIVGVHSPEFEFEKSVTNVQQAVDDFGILYPVMQDNDFATWRAYQNRYWPAKYLIDAEGVVRYTHFGEGKYAETEVMIQTLLKEAGASVSATVQTEPLVVRRAQTPELYLGHARLEHLVSPELVKRDQPQRYSVPSRIPADTFAYQGGWTVMAEYAQPEVGSALELDFMAQEVYLVARPVGQPGSVKVFVDDTLVNTVLVDSDRLYELLKVSEPGRHRLRLEFTDQPVELYAFTFG